MRLRDAAHESVPPRSLPVSARYRTITGTRGGEAEFRILGPLELVDEGRQVELAGGRQRALLALLLLHANEVVSSDRLIDGLWGERPPATASKVLQNAVSQLRRALGDGLIVTRAPGYLLQVEPDAIDAPLRIAGRGRQGGARCRPGRGRCTDPARRPGSLARRTAARVRL